MRCGLVKTVDRPKKKVADTVAAMHKVTGKSARLLDQGVNPVLAGGVFTAKPVLKFVEQALE